MAGTEWLAGEFEHNRAHLRAVAYRMLGSPSEADDAVQEAWLRLERADVAEIHNLGGWLTTVVARVCLDMLRSRDARREDPLDQDAPEPVVGEGDGVDPERQAVLADAMGPALLVVLDTLAPAERLAFVLHDLFAVPYEQIGPIVGRSGAAARQLASRARRRVQGARPAPDGDVGRQRTVVTAFLAASRAGSFEALLAVLDPDVVLRADAVAVALSRAGSGAPPLGAEIRGADAVAATFLGRARGARPMLVDGAMGAAWVPEDRARAVFEFTVVADRIVGIMVHADPLRIENFSLYNFSDD